MMPKKHQFKCFSYPHTERCFTETLSKDDKHSQTLQKPPVEPHASDSFLSSSNKLYTRCVCVSGKMAMISGFVLLCMIHASVPQPAPPRGARPVPGRGDSPDPTPPPLPPEPTPPSECCESELYKLSLVLLHLVINLI